MTKLLQKLHHNDTRQLDFTSDTVIMNKKKLTRTVRGRALEFKWVNYMFSYWQII